MKNKKPRVVVAMSGGVDSSVAAYLLKEQGYEIIGVFMRFWSPDEVPGMPLCAFENLCCSAEAKDVAQKTANKLKIPFHVLDLRAFFRKNIVNYFIDEYLSGKTPNPCVVCGQKIKFQALFQKARKIFEADYIATGHYSTIRANGSKDLYEYKLLKGKDKTKDQSYFLYTANQKVLKHFLFPIGDYKKEEVRKIAKENNLPSYRRKESQEICFVPSGDYREFLKSQLNAKNFKPGKIVDANGKVIGIHKGIAFYTIGQRRGIGDVFYKHENYTNKALKNTKKEPLYVIEIKPKENLVVVGSEKDLYKKELLAKNVNWIFGKSPKQYEKVKAKVRYQMTEQEALVYSKGNQAKVIFQKNQRAITPGQSIVFYSKDEALGGGVIEKVL